MSRPRLPVETVSISIFSRLPSFIAEPLPNARSICASAASSAFCLSILPESNPVPTTLSCADITLVLSSIGAMPMWSSSSGGRAPPFEGFRVYALFRENKRGTLDYLEPLRERLGSSAKSTRKEEARPWQRNRRQRNQRRRSRQQRNRLRRRPRQRKLRPRKPWPRRLQRRRPRR